jgi:hypothetical protein
MSDGTGAQSGTTSTDPQSGDPNSQSATNGGQNDSGAQSGTNSNSGSGNPDLDQVRADLETQKSRTQAADKRAAQLEAELKAIRDKDLPAAEKMQRDLEEATAKATQLEADLQTVRIENAFLKSNSHKWKNPAAALKLADLSGVEIGADGTVTGMKQALDALAKSDPYLLDDEKDPEKKGQEKTPPPGTPPANNGTGGSGKPDRKRLENRFPVMRTRPPRS